MVGRLPVSTTTSWFPLVWAWWLCIYWFFNLINLFWLHWVLVSVQGIFDLVVACVFFKCGMQTLRCGMWNPVPWPGIRAGPPALRAWGLSHWTTRKVPIYWFFKHLFIYLAALGLSCDTWDLWLWYTILAVPRHVGSDPWDLTRIKPKSPAL